VETCNELIMKEILQLVTAVLIIMCVMFFIHIIKHNKGDNK
jgi:succinate dehydrogenase hydrophobic anchor subunit